MAEIKYLEINADDRSIIIPVSYTHLVDANPLWFLGKSLELLAGADIAYFAKGWQDARGCRIEHTCAVEYNIDRIEP